jgi:hypothetical protein
MTTRAQGTPRCAAVLLWLAAAAPLFLPSAARADEPSAGAAPGVLSSEQWAAEAYEAYSREDYRGAIALYTRAYEAAPDGAILYNIARIYDTKLGNRQLAATFYGRYVAEPGAYTERVAFAKQRISVLRAAGDASKKLPTEPAPLPDADSAALRAEQANRRWDRRTRGRAGRRCVRPGRSSVPSVWPRSA